MSSATPDAEQQPPSEEPASSEQEPSVSFEAFDIRLIETLDTEDIAKATGIPTQQLRHIAEQGLLPPWLCDPCPRRGWVFHPQLTAKDITAHQNAGYVWVPNVAEDVSTTTLAWLDTQTHSPERRRELLAWLRAFETDPLEVSQAEFAWWCCHHVTPGGDGTVPSADVVALRWETLHAWYEMLTEAGIGHSSPHHGTEVAVVTTEDTEWRIFDESTP